MKLWTLDEAAEELSKKLQESLILYVKARVYMGEPDPHAADRAAGFRPLPELKPAAPAKAREVFPRAAMRSSAWDRG
jgi:hypothetical protein